MFSVRSLCMDVSRNDISVSIFQNISFDVSKGQFVAVAGASGCGKTTLLRCMAGLTPASSGEVLFRGARVTAPCKDAVMVFQDYGNSLFPWKSVLGNVLFGMEQCEGSRKQKADAAMHHLEAVGLGGFSTYHPWELSGGMQQRLAIARALAGGAECLLMDEPFASLDAQTRAELEDLLLRIWAEWGRTIIFVTHDVDEALYLSDRILLLGGGVSSVVADVANSLPRPRQQLETRAESQFSELRKIVFTHLTRQTG